MTILSWVLDRVIKNWQTSVKFIAPAVVGFLANKGYNVPVETVTLYLTGVYGIILLFSKDGQK